AHESFIPARYRPHLQSVLPRQFQIHRLCGEDVPLVHGLDPVTGRPDWLGEIFEWLSCSDERNIEARDSLGRIPYTATLFGRQNISPRKPYAGVLMAGLEHQLRAKTSGCSLTMPTSPIPEVAHCVVCTHDIDFYFTDFRSAFRRLVKNLIIALVHYR